MRADSPWLAVATDLDGTIVRPDGTVSEATIHAARALRAAGVPLLAATARTPAGILALDPLASLLDLAICCGGSLGWLPDADRVLWQDDIGQPAVRDVIRAAEASLESVGIAGYDGHQWIMSGEYPAIRGFRPRGRSRFATLPEIAAVPLCAMALAHPHLHPEQMTARLMAAGLDPAAAHFTYAADRLLDVTPAGVDKGTGLRKALKHLGIAPSGVIAFGDMPNDLPMFDIVGCSVAVANAHPSVLAAASLVTDPVDDDGVAHALEQVGLSRRPRRIQPRSADTERW